MKTQLSHAHQLCCAPSVPWELWVSEPSITQSCQTGGHRSCARQGHCQAAVELQLRDKTPAETYGRASQRPSCRDPFSRALLVLAHGVFSLL